jgi:hypothetical protein
MRIDATEPTTVSVPDVARAMRGRGLEVAETGTVVTHRVLRVAGERLQIDGVSVDVYLYPSAAERVADEQRWNDQIMGLTSTRADPPRVTSVENVLVLIASSDPDLHLTVTRALNDLSGRSTVQILAQ